MIVFYHPLSLEPINIVAFYAEQYRQFVESTPQQWPYKIIEGETLRPEEVEILPGGQWRRRVPMVVVAPSQVAAGITFPITGVPAGSEISLNGVVCGSADGSQIDMELGVAGFYQMQFRCSGYITKEITVEAFA